MRYRRLFFVSAICIILAFLIYPALANNRVEIEWDSINEYQQLISFFDDINNVDEACSEYPDYYAGAYLNENGELVVLVTDGSRRVKNEIREVTGNKATIIETAPISYNELREEQYRIAEKWLELYNDINNGNIEATEEFKTLVNSFEGVGIDDEFNVIVVDLKDKSEENLLAFKKYISDYPSIKFSSPVEFE